MNRIHDLFFDALNEDQQRMVNEIADKHPEYVISHSRLEGLGKQRIGRGGFSKIFLVKDKETEANYAAKHITCNSRKYDWCKLFCRELSLLLTAQGTGVMKLRGFTREAPLLILTDIYENDTLTRYLMNPANAPKVEHDEFYALAREIMGEDNEEDFESLPNNYKVAILIGIVSAVECVHRHGIIHMDLKASNVFMDKDMNPVLADFGNATFEANQDDVDSEVGTAAWMAPERFSGKKVSQKVDIYAIGILMWVMVMERKPMSGWNLAYLICQVSNGKRLDWDSTVHPKWREIAEMCWDTDPEKRPSASALLDRLCADPEILDGIDRDWVNARIAGYRKM